MLVHWGQGEYLLIFQREDYILMTFSLLAVSRRATGTKPNKVCNLNEFLTNFIPEYQIKNASI